MASQDKNFYDEFVLKTTSTHTKIVRRRSFKVYHKLQIVKLNENGNSIRSLAKQFCVYRSTIQKWIKNKANLIETLHKYRRCYCLSQRLFSFYIFIYSFLIAVYFFYRACKFPEVETELKTWIQEQRVSGACIDGFMITNMAIRITLNLGINSFKGLKGWLVNFLRRNRLV